MGVCVCVITKRSGSGSASSRCHEGKRGWSGWGNGVSTYSVLIAAPPVGGMRYLRVSERERERERPQEWQLQVSITALWSNVQGTPMPTRAVAGAVRGGQ